MSQQIQTKTKKRAARAAVVATVAGALSLPLVSQHLRAQAEPAKPAAAKADAKAAAPTDPSAVIASAGDIKVTAGEFNAFLSGLPPQQQAQVVGSADEKKMMADRLLKTKALAGEAARRKLDQGEKFKAQLDAIRMQLLVQQLAEQLQGDEAGDKKFFEQNPEQFGKVQARHILIGTRSQDGSKPALSEEAAKKKADDIRARLAKGEDFAGIAKTDSDDPGSKATGGEYTFGRGEMVPAFEQTAYGLKENEISQPVKTQFGYHIIQLMKRLPGTFEDSRQAISGQRFNALVKELTGGAETKFDDAFFAVPAGAGPALPGLPPAPPAPPATPAK